MAFTNTKSESSFGGSVKTQEQRRKRHEEEKIPSQSGSPRSPRLFLPHLHVPILPWAAALWGQLLLLRFSTATNPAGIWAVELQVMGRAKAPWLRGVWQCHRHYSIPPHLIQQLGPKL